MTHQDTEARVRLAREVNLLRAERDALRRTNPEHAVVTAERVLAEITGGEGDENT